MLNPNYSVYINKDNPDVFLSFITENNFFIILEIESTVSLEKGKEIEEKIKQDIANVSVKNLSAFDHFIVQIITKYNLPPALSVAAVYHKEDVMYLKTIGEGRVYLKRRGNFAQIIGGDKSASGRLQVEDFFVLTTQKFIELLGSDLELKTIFDHKDPDEIVIDLKTQLTAKIGQVAIALFIQFKKDQELVEDAQFIPVSETDQSKFRPDIKNKAQFFLLSLQELSLKAGKKKTYTLVAVVIILFILIWSVVLGYQRRSNADANKKIKSATEAVNLKLGQAEEVAFLNLARAMTLLSEAKKEVEQLKKEVGTENNDVKKLETSVKMTENKIVKKEEKNYEEFYDLTLDSKGAKGSKLYLKGEDLNIIDTGKGVIYTLSLLKKSLDKNNAADVRQASLVSSYQDYLIFFVEGEGIYKISADNKNSKVIDNDKDWGKIQDMWIFNGNLYLLDSVKGDIYKYLVAEKGYSEKSSYLGGNSGTVNDSNSLAIDSSVYIGLEDKIVKFTAGARDDFKTSWPQNDIRLTKIFTSGDVEKVYAWSKSKGAVYVLGKNGTYEKQINSSILTKATDLVVFEDTAYILFGEKLYKIDLK